MALMAEIEEEHLEGQRRHGVVARLEVNQSSVFALFFLFLFAGARVAISAARQLAAPAALITFSHDTVLLSDVRSLVSEYGWFCKNWAESIS
jgi:hypothetical protein